MVQCEGLWGQSEIVLELVKAEGHCFEANLNCLDWNSIALYRLKAGATVLDHIIIVLGQNEIVVC